MEADGLKDPDLLEDIKGAATVIYGAGADTVGLNISEALRPTYRHVVNRLGPHFLSFFSLWSFTLNANEKLRMR